MKKTDYLIAANNFLFYARQRAAPGVPLEINGKKISLVAQDAVLNYGSGHEIWHAFIVLDANNVRVVKGVFAIRPNAAYWTGWTVEDMPTDKARDKYREVSNKASWKKTATGHVSGVNQIK